MKYIIAVLLAALVAMAAAEEYKIRNQDDLLKARKECMEAKKVPTEHIEKFKKFEFPDDEVTRCYIECIFNKFQLFSPTEGFKTQNLIAQLGQNKENKDAVKADIEKCADKNEQKSDSCTWAYRGFKCFISKNLPLVQESLKKN
ncbi:general odorant-binding protein 99a [Bactrocera oleae]|uniref:general odorant-binding protein 99a n=1 Tax=Bactrocera oleae TaxID=104688 RepID=UPI0006B77C06|nr:general odorant-binding protein 99a [Bactrocera oleae]XP_036219306.1 general odorant-binding protein 99a [Bactrocera oleae]